MAKTKRKLDIEKSLQKKKETKVKVVIRSLKIEKRRLMQNAKEAFREATRLDKQIRAMEKTIAKKNPTKKKIVPKKTPPKFHVGDFVYLMPFEGNPGEYGQVTGPQENDMYIVTVNKKHSTDDDQLRELSGDQMRLCTHMRSKIVSDRGSLVRYHCPDCERTWEVDSGG